MVNKSLATIQILDLLGNPISKVQYEVKNSKTGEHVVRGFTNSKGCLYEIQRDKGTVLDIYVKSLFGIGMKKVQTFTMSKDRMLVTVTSPKILLDLKTVDNNGSQGSYKRKTHTIKKGETLSSIAQKYQTTVRALERLNRIKDANRISIGQVIKLPVNTPATGNNISTNKKTSTQPIEKSKIEDKKVDKGVATTADTGIATTFEEYQRKALEQLNEWYEEGKKALSESVKIDITEDRSQESGTPKTNTKNLCENNPQCISKGQSELIREVNIRLAGFGGALPTDEFTPLTAQCIKQFQRDYMGVPETGKICGSVLVALDKFYYEYPITNFMAKASCPCGECSGYGMNRRNTKSGFNTANEYPGLHRSLIWILKALNFYLKNEFKPKGLEVAYIESGYRCIDDNKKKGRTTVNHMGLALDIHIKKNGKRTKAIEDIEFVRKEIMAVKMGASEERSSDKIYLEPTKFKSGANGATTWIHFDVTKFSNIYREDIYFKRKLTELNGDLFKNIILKMKKESLLGCSGITNFTEKSSLDELTDKLVLSDQDIIDIIKVTETEVIKFKTEKYFYEQAAGVVDTILNRVKSGVWGTSVRSVVNAYRQFSKITGPKNLKPYGSVQKMPMSAVSLRIKSFVNAYLIERSKGKKSIIGGHLNYANKYYSDEYNREKWVNKFHDQAEKDGLIFGNGKAIHAHGTVEELKRYIPEPFKIILPENFKGF